MPNVALAAQLRDQGWRLRHDRLEDVHGHRLAGDVRHWLEGMPADARVRRLAIQFVADAGGEQDAYDVLPAIGLMLADTP